MILIVVTSTNLIVWWMSGWNEKKTLDKFYNWVIQWVCDSYLMVFSFQMNLCKNEKLHVRHKEKKNFFFSKSRTLHKSLNISHKKAMTGYHISIIFVVSWSVIFIFSNGIKEQKQCLPLLPTFFALVISSFNGCMILVNNY